MDILYQPNGYGAGLWEGGLAQRVIDYPDSPRKIREQALLLKSPEAVELHLRRARGKAATKRAASEVIQSVTSVMRRTQEQDWWEEG